MVVVGSGSSSVLALVVIVAGVAVGNEWHVQDRQARRQGGLGGLEGLTRPFKWSSKIKQRDSKL